jgi:hypothetical protein
MSTYTVGRGKPPIASRFKKGQSGNPKGRPKASKSPRALVDITSSCLLDEIELTVNGKRQKLQALEAILLRLRAMALNGDVRAAKFLLDVAVKYVPNRPTLEQLMRDKAVFSWTAEDEEACSKARLFEGVTYSGK